MAAKKPLGGVIHTYQKFDPKNFPSPTAPPPDMVSSAFEHMLIYGSMRELTEEELARAVHLDPSQIAGLGPSLDAIREMLLMRKEKILSTYETRRVQKDAAQRYQDEGRELRLPSELRKAVKRAFAMSNCARSSNCGTSPVASSPFANDLLRLAERLGDKYQIDEMAGKYEFTGHTRMTIPQALDVKEELEKIDELLKQLDEAARTAQIGLIDMEQLSEFADPGDIEQLNALHQQIQDYLRDLAEQQGLEKTRRGFQLTPKAYRLFQGKLLERIFSELAPSRTGRHQGPIVGEGAVELQHTKPYEFGDSVTQMDIPATLTNAMIRGGATLPIRLRSEDIEIHRTRNTPKCATVVLMDMSGSMRYGGLYVNVKRMGLALDGLIRSEFPGDFLQFIEMYTFAKPRHTSEIASLLPKYVSISDPWVRHRVDMSREDITEAQVPQHFTNIQHALAMSRKFLALQPTPNRQVILITDGLPTAHFEGEQLYLCYPPDERTERATMRKAQLCQRDGITINIFLLSSWSQSREDVQFAYRLAESTKGRVFFTAGRDLDRYVVWDYVSRKRQIIS